ncbi:exonuclease domain-containing protein [Aquirufa nivalisilvae]|jgi:DNA polymerase-3 subunit epsilon|uniref:DNA-directed DNA polymerase n=1 Tax=Aquirufa nivalisilvae TaxID=2516557 RepID=A0A2S2DYR6_9BACT|nr:3'-5' exonuclease [Aquirufa nivalisilvae]AWL10180.1 DNA-directed DNA polymerase [Aquirufa nivalisilvae]MCZ2479924.1 3'-5' exonuclease [Aquirufa nivalisilvae]TBH76014.1 3'-5' exonuclease [Aquirufa nivalisilvae]
MEHQLKLTKPLAFFDLETTGIQVQKDRIVEISIAKANIDGSVDIKTRRVNPGIPIPLEASLVHGIYDEDVKDEPNFKQIAKSMAQFLEGCDLAGFNSNRFDVPMLVEEFLRSDVDFDTKNRRLVDAQRIFHMMEPRNLTAAYKFYCQKDLIGAHGAEADVLATLEVLNAQVKHYENTSMKDAEGNEYFPIQNDVAVLHQLSASNSIDFANRMVYNKDQVAVFNFGKYIGRPIADVLKTDPSYYDWMMKGDFPMDTKRKLTEIKLKGFQR